MRTENVPCCFRVVRVLAEGNWTAEVAGRGFELFSVSCLFLFAVVQDYFTRFGYVLDVYMPRDKMNRNEHRGFGFVTFETEGAVARVATHGTHQIKYVICTLQGILHTCFELFGACKAMVWDMGSSVETVGPDSPVFACAPSFLVIASIGWILSSPALQSFC
jgi:hypothetical protein